LQLILAQCKKEEGQDERVREIRIKIYYCIFFLFSIDHDVFHNGDAKYFLIFYETRGFPNIPSAASNIRSKRIIDIILIILRRILT
jgi:hypothetical protein